jgi:hypothetical protein
MRLFTTEFHFIFPLIDEKVADTNAEGAPHPVSDENPLPPSHGIISDTSATFVVAALAVARP